MARSTTVKVAIDLGRVRANAEAIRRATGVPIIAVVKADAYGLGAMQVSRAIADLVDGFYVFDLGEAIDARLAETGRRTLLLRAESSDPDDYLAQRAQPAVWHREMAGDLRRARPVLSVDSGQQRFGVPIDQTTVLAQVIASGDISEAFTHATRTSQAAALRDVLRDRLSCLHAAGSALIAESSAWLDRVRPGLALYRGAVRVSSLLIETTDTRGPAGYTGFTAKRHGVIVGGYCNGIAAGPCAINGRRAHLPEVGMQSAFVELDAGDRVGDEVVLLGDGITEQDVAAAWNVTPQEALLRLCSAGERTYIAP
jgi:alanine racemase